MKSSFLLVKSHEITFFVGKIPSKSQLFEASVSFIDPRSSLSTIDVDLNELASGVVFCVGGTAAGIGIFLGFHRKPTQKWWFKEI